MEDTGEIRTLTKCAHFPNKAIHHLPRRFDMCRSRSRSPVRPRYLILGPTSEARSLTIKTVQSCNVFRRPREAEKAKEHLEKARMAEACRKIQPEDLGFSEMEMEFLEEDGEASPESCSTESEEEESVTERKAFWESQHQLLKGVLCRISSVELMIRNETERVLRESREEGPKCVCGKGVKGGLCRNCLMRDVTDRLRKAGHDSGICKSKWRKTPDIPSGEHTYIDVVGTSSSKKMSVRVVIELDFRAEFEMARGSPEYNRLIDRLPQVFVGKAERLRSLIKISCEAAKKCMKDNNMHMGPWRKHKYMQAKWLGTCERIAPTPPSSVGLSDSGDRQGKLRGSMLTFHLVDNLPAMHCPVVKVI